MSVDLFGGADLALGEFVTKLHKRFARAGFVFCILDRSEVFDQRLERLHARKVYGIAVAIRGIGFRKRDINR